MIRGLTKTGFALVVGAASACFSPTGSDSETTTASTSSTTSTSSTDTSGATTSTSAEPTTTAVTTDATGPATTLEPSTGVASTTATTGTTMAPDGCADTVQNGDETDVDCGGSCAPCENDKACLENADCVSQACQGNTCVAPSCVDASSCPAPLDCHAIDCVDFTCVDTPLDGVVCDDGRVCTNDDNCAGGTCVASTPKPISLTDVAMNPDLGLHFDGNALALRAGYQVAYGGDINGDGIADLLLSSEKPTQGTPRAFVVFGGPTLATTTLDDVAAGNGGFVIELDSFNSVINIAALGDFNGDKRDDIAVGMASYLTGEGSGAVYVIFGKSGDTSPIKLTTLGNSGIVLWGPKSMSYLGTSVIGLGDLNNDKRQDFAVGAPGYKINNASVGAVYLVFGQANLANGAIDTLVTQGGAKRLEGPTNSSDFGRVVGAVGDFNMDGRNDLAVGAPNWSINTGRTFVIYLPPAPLNPVIPISDTPMPNDGLVITGALQSSKFGSALAPAGDFNDDGTPDLLVGSDGILYKAVVVLGGGLIGGTISAAKLVDDKKGFILSGLASEKFGSSVWGGLDVNGDSFKDIIVGAPNANTNGGRAYVVFGRATPANINTADLALGQGGFVIEGQGDQQAGGSVGMMTDINGDGRNELLVGAKQYDVMPNDNAGRVYIVHGGDCSP